MYPLIDKISPMSIVTDFIPAGTSASATQVDVLRVLQHVRKLKDLTQEQLAELAGMNRLTVIKAEGGNDTRLSTIIALCRALELELVPVPRHLVQETVRFVNNGGRQVSMEPGIEAPLSIMQRKIDAP